MDVFSRVLSMPLPALSLDTLGMTLRLGAMIAEG
jgi:hypothetical protein